MTLVKLNVIGYHCNCLDGQHNYWASAHRLIVMSDHVLGSLSCICNCALVHSSSGFRMASGQHKALDGSQSYKQNKQNNIYEARDCIVLQA